MAQIGNIALIVALVVAAAFATILMIVGNTMVMAVRERTREIGVLKTLGFSGGHILRLVLGESLLLALLGGLPGIAPACAVRREHGDQPGKFRAGVRGHARHCAHGRRIDAGARPRHRPDPGHQRDAAEDRDGSGRG